MAMISSDTANWFEQNAPQYVQNFGRAPQYFGADTPNSPTGDSSTTPPTTPTAPPPPVSGPSTTFHNTSSVPPGRPNGVPDPSHPGYDTAGWLLSSKVNADGTITVPNPQTGMTTTVNPSTLATSSALTPDPSQSILDRFPNAASLSSIYGPMPTIPTIPKFIAPTGADVLASDPSFGFELGQGEQALQQAAAARGTLNTGGTLKDIIDYAKNFSGGAYEDAFNRALTGYNTNVQNQYVLPYNAAFGQYQEGVTNFNNNFDQQLRALGA